MMTSEETQEWRDFFSNGIETIAGQRYEIKRLNEHIAVLEERITDREGAEHYGPYGANCMNTGQFDAGECWLCYAKRKKQEAAEMQLVAGRYQYQFEHAMKCINSIDDLFEYAYKGVGRTELRDRVRNYLAVFTAVVKPRGK